MNKLSMVFQIVSEAGNFPNYFGELAVYAAKPHRPDRKLCVYPSARGNWPECDRLCPAYETCLTISLRRYSWAG